MKNILLCFLCCAMLFSTVSCNKSGKTNSEKTNDLIQISDIEDSVTNYIGNESTSIVEKLNKILQKKYTWTIFSAIYPQHEITAQSTLSMNVIVPEFENVVFVFSGALTSNISEYKMVSVNAGGDILLPEYLNKTFDEIISKESECANYVLSDDLMQHLYKYEDIYIYRDNFYYYIRGFRHLNKLTSDHIAMFLYDETHKRPW